MPATHFPYGLSMQSSDSSGVLAVAVTDSTSAPANERVIHGQLSLNYAGSVAITGSVAGVRGITTIASGTTVASGYVYGAQGKLAVVGTLSSGSNVSCGLLGQLDLSAATGLTGPIAALWVDCGATMSAGVTATNANIDAAVVYNTTGTKINSALRIDTNSTYGLDLTDEGGGHGAGNWIDATSGASAAVAGHIKLKINGAAAYLRYYATAT